MKLILLVFTNAILGSLVTLQTARIAARISTGRAQSVVIGGQRQAAKPTARMTLLPSPSASPTLEPTSVISPTPSPNQTPTPDVNNQPTPTPTLSQVKPSPSPAMTPSPEQPVKVTSGHYRVEGNRIVNPDGSTKVFKGTNRPSLEWSREGEHLSSEDYGRMKNWGFNLVRLPMNQKFWLESEEYRSRIETNVRMITDQGMDVILDLHWSDKGIAGGEAAQQRMADSRSVDFWRQVASRYKNNTRVLFELYNEPRDISADVWLNGGDTGDGFAAVGMQQLIDVIRNEVGADNLIIVNGLVWGFDHRPLARVRGKNIVYGTHVYGEYDGKKTEEDWENGFGFLGSQYPVMATEFGDSSDCSGSFSGRLIDYLHAKGFSWVTWAWYPGGCGFPSIISDWNGSPSQVGELIKQKLR